MARLKLVFVDVFFLDQSSEDSGLIYGCGGIFAFSIGTRIQYNSLLVYFEEALLDVLHKHSYEKLIQSTFSFAVVDFHNTTA